MNRGKGLPGCLPGLSIILSVSVLLCGCIGNEHIDMKGNASKTEERKVLEKSADKNDKEIIYGRSGGVICKIRRKYDDSGHLIKEKRKIFSEEYDKNNVETDKDQMSATEEYPVIEVVKYIYKNGTRASGKKYRSGKLVDEWTYDKDGNEIREAQNEVEIEPEIEWVPGELPTY